jgi:two-component system phosphate regulon response regulator PhoB
MAKILVVDDDPDIIDLVTETLTGHEILTAGDGLEGLALAQERKPDLVILDVGMPKLSGTVVCRRIKQDPATAHIPVIMLTGWGTVGDVEEAFANKANDYIVKPFSPKILKAKVEALLAGGAGTPAPK